MRWDGRLGGGAMTKLRWCSEIIIDYCLRSFGDYCGASEAWIAVNKIRPRMSMAMVNGDGDSDGGADAVSDSAEGGETPFRSCFRCK